MLSNWEELESLMTDGIAVQGRSINIYTNAYGADMIHHTIAVANAVDYVEWMEKKKKIESDVAKNLKTMLNSKDRDNFNIAILAIEQLKK
tara:strand:+ start:6209 stop:6478 length:270 start_codon:yes stop_codon:yes gene_type:complete